MLLFHGTGGPRALVERIVTEGLLPHGGRAWAERLTGVPEHVFACTTPIGTRDGDPIRWAQSRAWKQGRAWLVVVEPRDPALVVGAVRNEDLTRFWRAQAFADVVHGRLDDARAVHAEAGARGVPVRELVRPVVTSVAPGLVDGEPDPDTLVQFESAYYRAGPGQKARVARSYGLRIPAEFAGDPHHPYCLGCGHQLFEVAFELALADRPVRFRRGTWTRLDRETFATHVDALGRWLAACDQPALARWQRAHPHAPLDQLAAAFPPPADAPAALSPGLLVDDVEARMREPDTQVLLRRVPPEHVVGAIDLGQRARLSPLVRPARGETLLDRLRFLTSELRAARARTGRPAILA